MADITKLIEDILNITKDDELKKYLEGWLNEIRNPKEE